MLESHIIKILFHAVPDPSFVYTRCNCINSPYSIVAMLKQEKMIKKLYIMEQFSVISGL